MVNMACSSQEEQLFVTWLLLIPLPAPPYSVRSFCADHGQMSNVSSCTWATVQAMDLALAASVRFYLWLVPPEHKCQHKASASRAGGAQSQTPKKEGTQYLGNEIVLLEIACCKQNTFITLALCSPSYLSSNRKLADRRELKS